MVLDYYLKLKYIRGKRKKLQATSDLIKQKQIIIAMGEGAKAALGAFEYLITKY